ncbi:hypothetical protein N7517_008027 [Penicillium concentricum]|uniref:Uncharacterized protein n=1 Tax=Penicillium concentricum TaxID=293559 RepID=A0A9W9V3R8_9EURO|nr:uncharacterized protein N7517_008027 [Penicillium concentricum]KAJ5365141.1 hypothetical protein N7517_008027 [Penicillium concentricum]
MADSIHPLLFCKHCEVSGHDVVYCHRLFEDLTAFAQPVGVDTGYHTQGSTSANEKPYRIARWGEGRKRMHKKQTGSFANDANLNPAEAQKLAFYLEQHRRYWHWCRALWAGPCRRPE